MQESPEHLLFPDWAAPTKVKAAFTTRLGGHSEATFSSFNLANHVGDDLGAVATNRRQLQQMLNLMQPPQWLRQVHGNDVYRVTDKQVDDVVADAAITTLPGRACAVLVADCVPVLLCDARGSEVAAIHAGWRGLQNGVLGNTIDAFRAPPQDLCAWVGPHISQCKYEIQEDLRRQLLATDPELQPFFDVRASRIWLDLGGWCAHQLKNLGVTNVCHSDACVYTESERFYSYRRSGQTGRMAALIWIQARGP